MRPGNIVSLHPHLWAVLILVVGLVVTWFAYAPGIGGQLHFDDYHNLEGLSKIIDAESAFDFVVSGTAGPLGRPLALASFVPEAHAWPNTPSMFLRTNIAIHLLNGLLIAWFLYLLGRARDIAERPAATAAAAAAFIWMVLPILASSSLFIVQRMTTLSAAFALLGAIGYMRARLSIDRRPTSALMGMTFFLGLGALLAVLAKENGALIFLFILAAEATVLKRPNSVSPALWRSWFALVLLVPLAALTVFLFSVVPYSEEAVLRRGFTALERLATQAEILWKYLYLAFIPNIAKLGPYHDDYPIRENLLNVATILSVIGWAVLIAAAVGLRRRCPLLAFAVAWYLLGHLLESTLLSLELYFEHRNYLPLVGPVYALIASLTTTLDKSRILLLFGLSLYAGFLSTILLSITSLWGSPTLAAEVWYNYKPTSMRATQNFAGELQKQGDLFGSRRVLKRFIKNHPESAALKLEVLIISCRLEPQASHEKILTDTRRALSTARFSHSTAVSFNNFYGLVRENRCPSIKTEDIYELGKDILANNYFTPTIARHNIHITLANIGIERKDFSLTMKHMEAALDARNNPTTLSTTIDILNSGGRQDISRRFLYEAKALPPPLNPLAARKWNRKLEQLEAMLDDAAPHTNHKGLGDLPSDATKQP